MPARRKYPNELVRHEALAGLLRRGSANANTAADLIETLDAALASLPAPTSPN